jgi:riboflavin kinase/FMN adenylyltransferase
MRVFSNLSQLSVFKNSVITIGTFDGVHKGHQKLIARINFLASQLNGESVVITFHPHPRLLINPQDNSLRLLNTVDEKISLLEKYGVNNLVVVPFSRDFSEQTANEYIENFLVKNFHPKQLVIGYDHKFGKDRSGDFHLLEQMGGKFDYAMEEIPKEMQDDIGISSTKIRQALQSGEIKLATELLGHSYALTGTVVRGLQNGRKIGFPTANIHVNDEHKLVPKTGVYAVHVWVNGNKFNGMLNIGYNPTFEGKEQTVEVNILDFAEDIYGSTIALEFIEFMRDEKKFTSVELLIEAIKSDEARTRKILS